MLNICLRYILSHGFTNLCMCSNCKPVWSVLL